MGKVASNGRAEIENVKYALGNFESTSCRLSTNSQKNPPRVFYMSCIKGKKRCWTFPIDSVPIVKIC